MTSAAVAEARRGAGAEAGARSSGHRGQWSGPGTPCCEAGTWGCDLGTGG